MRRTTVRYDVERLSRCRWSYDIIVNKRSKRAAAAAIAETRRFCAQVGTWLPRTDFRIVRVTTTREVVR